MLPTVAADRILRPLLQIVLVAIVAFSGAGAAPVAWAWSLGVAASLVAGALWLRALANVRANRATATPSTLTVGEFWSFTLPRSFASVFRVGVQWLDIILVGGLISPRAAAIYTVATRLLQAGFLAVDAVGQAVEPMFSTLLTSREHDRAGDLYQGATGWLVGLTWPLFLAMWIFAPAVLGLFGSEYREATAVVAILAGSALIGSGFGPVDVLLVMSGKTMWSFWNSAVSLSLNVALNFLLIPSLGLRGAALAWAVSRIVANLLPLIEVRILYGFHPFGTGWRVAAALSLVVFGLGGLTTRYLAGDTFLVFLGYGIAAAAIYVAAAWKWRTQLQLAAFTSLLGSRWRTSGARS
jgi:O-antigen/teichoic acid export membrane protein